MKSNSHPPAARLKTPHSYFIHETGLLPPGVLNLVTGPGAVTGPELCTNPMIDKIAFTGSIEVGQEVMRQAAPFTA